ncbi:MAG: GNAT family N-acetyltransferase [Xanthomonadales bacterium]|nr:GNAT family N-acetyltransferase [Xanthomonadales bacterium]
MNSSALNIRPAAREDCALILELIRELAAYEKLAHHVVASREGLEASLFDDAPVAEVVIAEWHGGPAGFALYFPNYSTFLGRPGMYLEDLFVRPQYRNKGIGKALLVHLARIVVARGWGRLDWSVLDWNTPAIEFYEALGARPLDDWTQFRLDGEALATMAERRD